MSYWLLESKPSQTSTAKHTPLTLDLDDGYLKASESAKDKNKSRSPNTRKNETYKEFETWKVQNASKKTYVVDPMYPDLKKALNNRGILFCFLLKNQFFFRMGGKYKPRK